MDYQTLHGKTVAELRKMAKEMQVKVPAGTNKAEIITRLIESERSAGAAPTEAVQTETKAPRSEARPSADKSAASAQNGVRSSAPRAGKKVEEAQVQPEAEGSPDGEKTAPQEARSAAKNTTVRTPAKARAARPAAADDEVKHAEAEKANRTVEKATEAVKPDRAAPAAEEAGKAAEPPAVNAQQTLKTAVSSEMPEAEDAVQNVPAKRAQEGDRMSGDTTNGQRHRTGYVSRQNLRSNGTQTMYARPAGYVRTRENAWTRSDESMRRNADEPARRPSDTMRRQNGFRSDAQSDMRSDVCRTYDGSRSEAPRRTYDDNRSDTFRRAYDDNRNEAPRRTYDENRNDTFRRAYDDNRNEAPRRTYDENRNDTFRRAYDDSRNEAPRRTYDENRNDAFRRAYDDNKNDVPRRAYDDSRNDSQGDAFRRGFDDGRGDTRVDYVRRPYDDARADYARRSAENVEITQANMNDFADGAGMLEIQPDGYGFLRAENCLPGSNDVYISIAQIRRFNLRAGDYVVGKTRPQREGDRYSALIYISQVNGEPPERLASRRPFEMLTPWYPTQRLRMENPVKPDMSMRLIDMLAPVGKGQRGMIVSQPKAGKTTLLKKIANAISENNPEVKLIVLLIDERPEEVTDMKRSIKGDVIYSTFDEAPENHARVSEMVLEHAQRLVEMGKDVVILLDSITRLARAYNMTIPPTGRSLSGGLDPGALYKPKKFFGAARNIENGGSLTIIATALVDTGSRMDDIIFEEFKGTGNMELHLDRKLSDKRIFPAVDLLKSGTRREELLLTPEELDGEYRVRKMLANGNPQQAVEQLLGLMEKTSDNAEFFKKLKSWMSVYEKEGFSFGGKADK